MIMTVQITFVIGHGFTGGTSVISTLGAAESLRLEKKENAGTKIAKKGKQHYNSDHEVAIGSLGQDFAIVVGL